MHQSPDQIFGELFIDMHLSGLWADGKLISDATPNQSPRKIIAAYRKAKSKSNFDLKAFAEQHFDFPVAPSSGFESDTARSVAEHINVLWDVLKREADKEVEGSSRIPLPHPYIVPGGRFNEIYYWDSFFTMLGLRKSGRIDMIRSMIDNFSYIIDQVGFIPNGNRTYFLGRSQPPFYACMVDLLAQETGEDVLLHYLPYLEKEYRFWMRGSLELNNNEKLNASERVVKLSKTQKLNRYWDAYDTPRPEMYGTDVHDAQQTDRNPNELFRDLRSACESGWDFSSRWLQDAQDLTTIHATELLPVDLNCLLYFLELTIAKAYEKLSSGEQFSTYYQEQAEHRKANILAYHWSEKDGFFMDYDFVKGEHKTVFSLAGIYPLYFKIATAEQAAACAKIIKKDFLKAGGVISTTITTAQQWDAPNGWAPLQWMCVQGLRNYGYDELADEIKNRWLALNTKIYKSTGKMLEKYNVVDVGLETGGGEYPVQDGFGWTNGVFLGLED